MQLVEANKSVIFHDLESILKSPEVIRDGRAGDRKLGDSPCVFSIN
jgi:hypothetical protein